MSDSEAFATKLADAVASNNSLLCVGLDPNPAKYPAFFPADITTETLTRWGVSIIDQTADLVCCYKPNFAFYEQYGTAGLEALRQTIAAVPAHIPVLLDAKRGDIGSTAAAYARAAFEIWGADAITISPYLGQDSISPFVAYPGKSVFVLCYTSNPTASQIQEFGPVEERLFEHVVRQAQTWGTPAQIGFVVGATRPQALAAVRKLLDGQAHWLLAPGIGAQGGDLPAALAAGLAPNGSGLIVPVSRGVIYADDPRHAALTLRTQINAARQAIDPAPAPSLPHRELISLLHEVGCIQFGDFTLASGKQSPIYIDLRRMSANPSLLQLTAQAYAQLLHPLTFDHLAAVPYAALTIGTAVALATRSSLIYPRKEVKTYGTGRSIEGVFYAGEQVAVIEDLVTSGGSVLKAIDQLEAAQLHVSDAVVLIDREQGGFEALSSRGYRLHAALKLSQILTVLQAVGQISAEQAARVETYLNDPA